MYSRAKYKDSSDVHWSSLANPVATPKRDGAHFYLEIGSDGTQKYYSRRESVKGGHPERSSQIPHLSSKRLPDFAGHVYNVELIHTGHNKDNPESHSTVSGILNSLPPRSIETQKQIGPVRAVLIDVVNPPLPTYKDKLLQMKRVEDAFGNPDLMFVDTPAITKQGIVEMIDKTKQQHREGVIITDLKTPESNNPRIKIKHFYTYNLRVNKLIQEIDIHGKPKNSMGALECIDRSGRIVCYVGTGFSREQREQFWLHPDLILHKLIQVKTMSPEVSGGRLRAPVFNGDADGELDLVN